MVEYTKKVLNELNKWKKNSFKIAQERALEDLARQFERWQKKRITADTLEIAIDKHKSFRNDLLEKQYMENGDPGVPVAEAIIRGDIRREDLSSEAYKSIEILIDLVNI
ncbi:MAG: hypothetical protein B6241_07455 [Spirochaetaceae bacterium 4572_59]|nr:MAG: hypothetical protein B6241_07455 [Spirochaetaceae bacterium 4572_59]